MIEDRAAYHALSSRDSRFDGVFFVGVASTGIYCRPICPARTPLKKNCRFFETAAAAEKAMFRPCLRCRPELAPGLAPVDRSQRIAHVITRSIDEGLGEGEAGLEKVAARFAISSRQLRRIIQKELGVSPIELVQTRRLLLAKQLLTETALPVTEIAFASGFASLRRFNDAFRRQYRMPPTRLRSEASQGDAALASADTSTLQLSYRAPFDWEAMLEFLSARLIRDVEWVEGASYLRTVRIGEYMGWIRVSNEARRSGLLVEFTHSLSAVLPALLGRLRQLFDLSAHPDRIAKHLGKDVRLRDSVSRHPGLRVPGAFDGFEMAVRAILGQQVTVKAATTLAGRYAAAFGDKIGTPFPALSRLSPQAGRVAEAEIGDIAKLGIVSARSASILAMARAFDEGSLRLESGPDHEADVEKLVQLPGIGHWTAQYIAMRALRWPDAFPKEDIAVRNNLGGVSAKQAEELSVPWRPWRSYAVMHIWKSLKPEQRP